MRKIKLPFAEHKPIIEHIIIIHFILLLFFTLSFICLPLFRELSSFEFFNNTASFLFFFPFFNIRHLSSKTKKLFIQRLIIYKKTIKNMKIFVRTYSSRKIKILGFDCVTIIFKGHFKCLF